LVDDRAGRKTSAIHGLASRDAVHFSTWSTPRVEFLPTFRHPQGGQSIVFVAGSKAMKLHTLLAGAMVEECG